MEINLRHSKSRLIYSGSIYKWLLRKWEVGACAFKMKMKNNSQNSWRLNQAYSKDSMLFFFLKALYAQ